MYQVYFLLLIVVHASLAKDMMIDIWTVSLDRKPFPQEDVNPGDTVTFKVLGPHNVFIHPSLSCNKTDRIEVPIDNNLATYTFQESDSNTTGNMMLFTCDAGTHCEMGQSILFRVYSTPETTAPTSTPKDSGSIKKGAGSFAKRTVPSLLPFLLLSFGGTWYHI